MLSIISGTMRSLEEILPNPNSSSLRGLACRGPLGRAQICCRNRGRSRRQTQRTYFPMVLRSSAGSVNRSPSLENVSPPPAGSLSQTLVILSPLPSSILLRCGSQKDLARGLSCSSEFQLRRIASLIFKLDQLTSSLRNSNQRLSEVEPELHSINVDKRALFATVELQALKILDLKAGKNVSGFSYLIKMLAAGPLKSSKKWRRFHGDSFTVAWNDQ